MSAHAPLAPSSAPQWGHCSGSVLAQMQVARPDVDSGPARNGTAAHWVVSEVLLNFTGRQQGPMFCSAYLGEVAPNGVIIDDGMAEGAQIMVDDVLQVCQTHGGLQALLVEQRVNMPRIHPQNWGTLDAALPVLDRNVLYIWDYKHGHRECKAFENLQMIDYVEGLCEMFEITGAQDQRITVVMRIVQPFCYSADGPVNEWRVRLSDLRAYFNTLRAKAVEAYTDPKLTTGLWCRDCTAVGTCAAARKASYNLIDLVDQPYEMDGMTARALATERAILKDGLAVLKSRIDAIEDNLHHRVAKGEPDSGLLLETGSGRLAWTIPPAQAIALAAQFKIDASSLGVLTPTQTKAAASKDMRGMFEQVLKTVTHRPAGKIKLVNAVDSTVARAFKKEE